MKHPLISHGVVYGSDPVAHYSCSSFYLHYWLIIIWYGKASASVSKCNHDTHCLLCPLTSGFLSPQMELSALQSMVAVQEQELQVQAADMESLTRTIQIKEDLIKVVQSFWKTLGNDYSSEYLHLQTALGFIESLCRCLLLDAVLVWASWCYPILSDWYQSGSDFMKKLLLLSRLINIPLNA